MGGVKGVGSSMGGVDFDLYGQVLESDFLWLLANKLLSNYLNL